ncbi:MAG TPA: 5'-3' exonuclease H3TH domain-containing protein, partial [Planctomycetaceae bacterium]|nr:5'-3' exonuclease H3TH domain-containing protein [Planctomycetaceae bacterium]
LAIDFLNILVRAFHAGAPTETHAVRSMMQTVANTIRKLQPAHVVFAMDGGHNLRSQLLPSYKAHRKPEDPLLTAQKKLAEDALYVAGFDMMRIEDWEADDVLATLAVTHSDTVIASCDKDLLALTHLATRCRVYHPWGAGEFMDSETKLGIPANHVTDYLALCGDTSDGIPGVIGIGPKTAAQLLTEYDSLEAIIVAAKLGNIKGAAGKKIAEQHQSALLCRRVVELNTRLPIKELHPFQPHPDWRMELQSMRLGSVAAIIESLNGQRFQISNSRSEISDPIHHPERETASATTQQVEPVENGSAGTLGFPADATAIDHRRQEATPPEATGRTTNPTGDTSDVIAAAVTSGAASGDSNYPHDSQQQLWHTAGFTELKESSGIPGTTLKPNWFACWRDGSKWLLDPNTKRHTCMSDSPFTHWRIDSRGPIDPKTNAVRH